MKDPHVGVFGVTGLVLVLFLKAAALAAISSGAGILLAASLARWCILIAGLFPLARSSGMGADFQAGFRRSFILWGALTPLAVALLLGPRGMLAAMAGVAGAALVLRLAISRIGGVTGDVFGMVVEIVESLTLLAFLAGA
jgi:adenosylcobinamide-GDP ribazoletransferase